MGLDIGVRQKEEVRGGCERGGTRGGDVLNYTCKDGGISMAYEIANSVLTTNTY